MIKTSPAKTAAYNDGFYKKKRPMMRRRGSTQAHADVHYLEQRGALIS
jgi:hypothetical protein